MTIFDYYLCPENKGVNLSKPHVGIKVIWKACPLLANCTESRQHQKVVVRHIW